MISKNFLRRNYQTWGPDPIPRAEPEQPVEPIAPLRPLRQRYFPFRRNKLNKIIRGRRGGKSVRARLEEIRHRIATNGQNVQPWSNAHNGAPRQEGDTTWRRNTTWRQTPLAPPTHAPPAPLLQLPAIPSPLPNFMRLERPSAFNIHQELESDDVVPAYSELPPPPPAPPAPFVLNPHSVLAEVLYAQPKSPLSTSPQSPPALHDPIESPQSPNVQAPQSPSDALTIDLAGYDNDDGSSTDGSDVDYESPQSPDLVAQEEHDEEVARKWVAQCVIDALVDKVVEAIDLRSAPSSDERMELRYHSKNFAIPLKKFLIFSFQSVHFKKIWIF